MDSFDAHIIVHTFLHKCRLGKGLRFVSDLDSVKSNYFWQMEQDKSLVVAKRADWIFTVVKITETAALK